MKIVYLTPKSSFRENLRSDTLWGLICWGINTVYSKETLDNFIADHKEGKVFKISSTYRFFREDENETLLFPKPILEPIDINRYFEENKISEKEKKASVIKSLKDYKKVKFIDKETFEKFLTGELNESKYFFSNLWDKKIPNFNREDVLHNQINRLTNTTEEGALFSTSELFANNGGLFFLMDGTEEHLKLATGALNFFSHVGFGGDSSIGKNHFDIKIDDFTFKKIENPNAFISLSLYSPKKEEITEYKKSRNYFWYELEARKGKFGGQFIKAKNFWKDSVLLFKEGSVFPNLNSQNYGRNIQVMKYDDMNIYQFGYAFNLPIKIMEKQ